MSTGKPGGSGRRRIAGDAARRRREQAAAAASTTEQPATGAAETEGTERPPDDVEPSADAEPSAERDESSAPTEESAPAAEPGADPRRTPRSRIQAPPRETWWWLAILAVVTVAAMVFVGLVGFRYLQERDDDAAQAELAAGREDAASAAATAAEEILSYGYQDLDADRADAEKLMTDDFRKQYGELFTADYCDAFPIQGECTVEGTFPEVVERNQQQVTASVIDVAPMECGDECSDTETRVLMFIDQSSIANGKAQAPIGNRAVFTMVEQDGDWLVDSIAYV